MHTLLQRILESGRTLCSIAIDADGRVVSVNAAYARHAGIEAASMPGQTLDSLVTEHEAARLRSWCAGEESAPARGTPLNFVTGDGSPFTMLCYVECQPDGGALIIGEPNSTADQPAADDLLRLNNELATLSRENVRRRRESERAQQELARALEELRSSYWHLQKIQEVIPICMKCGKLKSDAVEWKSVAEYFRDNEIFLSHGFCPTCAAIEMKALGFDAEEDDGPSA